ncbi:MAG: aldo/keto reductase, partial [Myxococcota bacterium]
VHEVKEHSTAQLAETHRELGAHLGLYQVHSATLDSGAFEPKLVDRLANLRDAGTMVGLSLSGPGQADTLRQALTIERGGARVFEAVQATWNLLERSVGGALMEAYDAGLGVIVKEALANGRLTDRGPLSPDHPWRTEARQLGIGLDALALAAAMSQPFVDVVLSGAATQNHLASNVQARLVPSDVGRMVVDVAPAEDAAAYWDTRSQLAWT